MLFRSAQRRIACLFLAAVVVALPASSQDKSKSESTGPKQIPALKPEIAEACKELYGRVSREIERGLQRGQGGFDRIDAPTKYNYQVCNFLADVVRAATCFRGDRPENLRVVSVLKTQLTQERWKRATELTASALARVNEQGIERLTFSPDDREEAGAFTIVIGAAAALALFDDEEIKKNIGPDRIKTAQKEAQALFDDFNGDGRIGRFTFYGTLKSVASEIERLKK